MSDISAETRLLRNLQDAGCEEAMVQKYLQLQEAGRRQEQRRLLAVHRASLLEQVHATQARIDCLDYLIYSLQREQKGRK